MLKTVDNTGNNIHFLDIYSREHLQELLQKYPLFQFFPEYQNKKLEDECDNAIDFFHSLLLSLIGVNHHDSPVFIVSSSQYNKLIISGIRDFVLRANLPLIF
jgi:hypothetical protein